jgi:TolB-like protein/DNA-binding winged helix-turn-helix (wHTH) protein/Tfp pilus assembly protein PilF
MKIYEFGNFRLDAESRKLFRQSGEIVSLTPRVFDLLLTLVENSERVVSKDELFEKVWADCIVEESNLPQSVFVLRKALGESSHNPQFIRTIPSQGYRFIAPVKTDDNHLKKTISNLLSVNRKLSDLAGWREKIKIPALIATFTTSGLVLLLLIGWNYFQTPPRQIDSIAVLPFTNASGDTKSDYLTDGLTENITNKLARLPRLKVLARSVVSKYKGKEVDPLKVGNELGVGAVLVGSMTQEGDALNISLELVETESGNLLWGESYQRKATDLLGLQGEITRRTTENLNLKLMGEEQRQLDKRYTDNAEAYLLYLKGRFFWIKHTKEGYEKAVEFYNQALEIDPNYALAYTGIADCYNMMAESDFAPPREIYPRAKAFAFKAIEIDENLAEGHFALAWIKFAYDWDWAGAEKEFQRAIELNPNHAQAHFRYSILLTSLGRFDEALTEIKRAYEIDPIYSERGMGTTLYLLRRYDEAIAFYKKSLETNPNSVNALWWLQRVYAIKGMKNEALVEMEKAVTTAESPNSTNTTSGNISLKTIDFNHGFDSAHQKYIQIYIDKSKTQYVSAYDIAASFALLKNKANAIIWLEKAFEDRSATMYMLAIDPVWDVLRLEPRFQEILRKMNLENVKLPNPQ